MDLEAGRSQHQSSAVLPQGQVADMNRRFDGSLNAKIKIFAFSVRRTLQSDPLLKVLSHHLMHLRYERGAMEEPRWSSRYSVELQAGRHKGRSSSPAGSRIFTSL